MKERPVWTLPMQRLSRLNRWLNDLAVLILLAGCCLPLHGAELPLERAFWIDASGSTSLDEALVQPLQPAPAVLSLGYTPAASWLRITLPPSEQPLWLVVQPIYLDHLALYSRPHRPDGSLGDWQLSLLGDHHPFSARPVATLHYAFELRPSPTRPTVVWLRTQTSSAHVVYATVETTASLQRFDSVLHLGVGVYIGVVLILALLALVRCAVLGDTLWGLNAVLHLLTVACALVFFGLPARYLWPDQPLKADALFSCMLCLFNFFNIGYFAWLARVFGTPRWLFRLLLLPLPLLPLLLWLIAAGHTREAMSLNALVGLLYTLLGMPASWLFRIDDHLLRRMVRGTHAMLGLYIIVILLSLLGVGRMTALHLYPAMGMNLLAAVTLYMVLSRRDQLAQREQQQLREQVRSTSQRLAWEQRRLAESASFTGMLLHELKNPLASIRLATLTLLRDQLPSAEARAARLERIEQSVDGIDAVLERCRQVDRLDQGEWELQRVDADAAALLRDWVALLPHQERVETRLPPRLDVRLEVGLFHTIFGNLLDNALRYSPPGSTIDLVLSERAAAGQSRCMMLTVRNAVGKAGKPDPARVFDKYYRAAHQTTGSGLGLFLVRRLSEMLGGSVRHRVENEGEPDERIAFDLVLPCV
ncbi:7TM-DISM domain-containing protein [Malikia spinosa]|jgi:signal transduction histidine kinase|uniref:histidine kinase n=2 Tax=Malikia spinosa TaxID=86180 RepID=A0A7C9NAW0_9BURK|nr:7TM-DISM domain-containing protein [Malikia spinosa]MYZ52245.1 hypothetical protein [Malikia spinosa]OGB68941.1 MAG: hypothetical protein A2486_03475 [Burkholderiales bacterium RIFOXYC12_FULL_65_23]